MKLTDLAVALRPFILKDIESAQSAVSGSFAPSPHGLNSVHHSGALATVQYPDALLADGSRALTGNLTVGAGVTVDGVDISALESDFSAHESGTAVSAHAGGVGDHSHQSAGAQGGKIDHGLALTGLGDDDHTQYLNATRHTAIGNAAPHHAPVTAGDGISVAGQVVTVDLATGSLLEFSSGDLRVAAAAAGDGLTGGGGVALAVDLHGTWSGLEIESAELRVDLDAVFGWTHLHTFGAGIDVDGTLEFQGPESITTTSGNLIIAPVGDLVLTPAGSDVRPGSTVAIDLGEYNYKWRTLYAAELYVETLVAQDVLATIGGRILVAPTTKLTSAVTNVATTIYVEHNNLAVNDYVMLETAPGGVAQFEVMQILTGPFSSGLAFRYTVSRNEDGTGANVWETGDAVANLGYAVGEGYLELTSTSTVMTDLGPNMTIYARTGTATWNDVAPTVAVGNLESFLDYSSDEFGVAAGDDLSVNPSTSVGGFSGFAIDRTNGLRLWNTGVKLYEGSELRIEMDPTATGTDAMFWAGPSSSEQRFVVTGDGDVWLSTLAISAGMGEWLFSLADGLLLLGQPLKVLKEGGVNYWGGTRGERATVTGALHLAPGRWSGCQAVTIEESTTNIARNPVMSNASVGFSYSEFDGAFSDGGVSPLGAGKLLRYTHTNVANSSAQVWETSTLPTFTSGTVYAVTFYARCNREQTFTVSVRQNGSPYNTGSNAKTVTAGVDFVRVEAILTLNTTIDSSYHVKLVAGSGWVDNVDWIEIAGVQIEEAAYSTSLCWGGAGDGYSWSGTAHASTSTRTATVVNLDAQTGLISGNETVSFRVVAQMPYDADGTWPASTVNYLMDAYGVSDRIIIRYRSDSDKFAVWINGADRLLSEVQTFEARDWVDVVVTLDYGNDEYNLYLNGVLVDSDTTSLTATAITDWVLGVVYTATSAWGNFTFAEFAVFDRVLTADEAAGMYAGQRPLVDGGAIERPGIYILDGEFRLLSSQTGQRVEITPAGVGIYDDTGLTGVARLLGGRVDTTGKVLDEEGDSLGWFGYDGSDVLQVAWYAEGANAGKVVAGAGDVVIDADGITIIEGVGAPNKIKWTTSGGDDLSDIHETLAAGVNSIVIGTYAYSTTTGQVTLVATDGGGSSGYLNVFSGGVETGGWVSIKDGLAAPSTRTGFGVLYIDNADGDLKIKFGDGTVKTIVTDT